MRETPRVTVVTPVLNARATIEDCLRSVADQDYPEIEHIVVDGQSSDGTLEILEASSAQVISERDSGIYEAINKGIARATGEIVHILNADDHYKHGAVVNRMVGFMLERELDVAHAKVEQVDARQQVRRVVGSDVSHRRLLAKCRVAHPSVFVRREVYERFGGFSTRFRIAADHEFLLRVWPRVAVGFIPEVTTVMRLGGVSNSEVRNSYRESMAAALLHGRPPALAVSAYYLELLKSWLLRVFRRR